MSVFTGYHYHEAGIVQRERAKRAFIRFAFGIGLLAVASAAFYYVDETAFAHEEIDGYIPQLLLLRLAFGIIVAGAFFVVVFPATVLALSAPAFLRQGRLLPPDDQGGNARLLEKLLSLVLYGLALSAAYFVLREPLDRAFLPLSGFGWVMPAFTYFFYGLLALVGLLLARRGWQLFAHYQAVAVAKRQQLPMVTASPISGATVSCASCGTGNPAVNQFCENCGERMGD